MGAKELPFEVDRKVLGRLIVALKDMQTRMQGVRDHIAREVLPVERQYTVGFGPKVEKRSFKFWRITFESEQSQEALHHGGWFDYKFDDLLKAELASHDGRLRSIAREIKDPAGSLRRLEADARMGGRGRSLGPPQQKERN